MNTAQERLLKLLKNELFATGEAVALGQDAEQVFDEALVQTVALIVFSSDCDELSPQLQLRVKSALNPFLQKNIAVNRGHLIIDEILRKSGIPYAIIKGLSSARFYPDYFMRLMGDVDFLVSKADFEKVDLLLHDNGFVTRKGERDHHITYDKDGVRYEMHLEPPGIPQNEAGEQLREYLADTVETAQIIEGEFGEISVPDNFHHGLIILLHNLHHLTSDGLGLRHLCDWAVFINSLSADEFSQQFETVLKRTGLLRFARVMSLVCEENLGCKNVFQNPTKEEKILANDMLADIFSGGNFGQKNADRAHEHVLISLDNSNESGIIKHLNKVVCSHWKIARKCKILLPFGWAFFSGRYVLRSILGKRPKIRPQSIVSEAQKRKEFYKKLKLFKI